MKSLLILVLLIHSMLANTISKVASKIATKAKTITAVTGSVAANVGEYDVSKVFSEFIPATPTRDSPLVKRMAYKLGKRHPDWS